MVSNSPYHSITLDSIYQSGYTKGFEDCLKAIDHNYQIVLELINKGLTPEEIIEHLKQEVTTLCPSKV